ncbi:MAG: RDD family protein [Microthrixaceae bacterium]|nr:RDD family protein [Microthrixaceae bacterium]MCB9387791.1 RDD family protein [Microthrixaceae bacterium]MCO5321782.1 RDD family protein [Microthrixaceae bacterium]
MTPLPYGGVRTGVVTPEAVLLDLPTAGIATRAFARVIDLVVQVVVAFALGMLVVLVGGASLSPTLVYLLLIVFTLLIWPIGMEILWRGRSVGKRIFSLRVISADGSPVQARQSVVRGLLALIDIYFSFGFVALLSAMFSPATQRLGDLAASTVVVRQRRSGAGETPVVFFAPAGFESYVSELDVSALSEEQFSLIREFLLRVGDLDPRVRSHEAMELAEAVRQRIHHELPASVDPELWLVCVAAAFQWQVGGLLREVSLGNAPVAPVVAGAPPRSAHR